MPNRQCSSRAWSNLIQHFDRLPCFFDPAGGKQAISNSANRSAPRACRLIELRVVFVATAEASLTSQPAYVNLLPPLWALIADLSARYGRLKTGGKISPLPEICWPGFRAATFQVELRPRNESFRSCRRCPGRRKRSRGDTQKTSDIVARQPDAAEPIG